jgi:hypothetical protein
MEITTDLLKTIKQRATQFAITKFGSEPDRMEIEDNGTLYCKWIHYGRCGDVDEETEYITAENLTEDLDAVAAERVKRLEEERIKREAYENAQKRIREERERDERKRQYEKLKLEFDN